MYTEEKYLLMALLSHRRIKLYDFYADTCFSTGQIVRAVFKFQRRGYLILLGKVIIRTPLGALKMRSLLRKEIKENNRYWAQVPGEYLKKRVPINAPFDYIKIHR